MDTGWYLLVPLTWSPTLADLHVCVPKETIEYPIPYCYSTWSANVHGFRESAAIHEYLNVNGHIHSSSQSIMSCITKWRLVGAWSAAPCNFTGYGHTLLQEERTDTRDGAQYMAYRFSASLHCNSEQISVASFAGATKPFSNKRHAYLLVDVKCSDAALHLIR